jgi:hypothetical protein
MHARTQSVLFCHLPAFAERKEKKNSRVCFARGLICLARPVAQVRVQNPLAISYALQLQPTQQLANCALAGEVQHQDPAPVAMAKHLLHSQGPTGNKAPASALGAQYPVCIMDQEV